MVKGYNEDEIAELLKTLYQSGWKFDADSYHPLNKEIGYYNARTYGWWTKESHPQKSMRVGDSRPAWMAARTVEYYFV